MLVFRMSFLGYLENWFTLVGILVVYHSHKVET